MIETKFDPKRPLRYVRYGRMSTSEQNERSPDQQFDEIDRVIQRRGHPWTHCGDYRDDGISGRYVAKRKDFVRMLENIKTGRIRIDVVLVDTLERFGRMKDLELIRRELRTKYGVLILTADSGFADPTSVEGQALGIVETIRSTQDARVKAHNVLRGKRDAALLKRWPGGPAPRGYKLETKIRRNRKGSDDVHRVLVPNPDEARIVKAFYHLAREKGWGGTRIAKHFNAQPAAVEKFGRFHPDTIIRILANPIYRGELVFNRVSTDVVEDRRIIRGNAEDQWVRVEGFCEPLVTDEIWSTVNKILKARGARVRQQRARKKKDDGKQIRPLAAGICLKYELTGLVRCGLCGSSLRPNKSGGCSKNGKVYVYYMCPNHQGGSCTNQIYLPIDWLRKAVFGALRRRLFPPPEQAEQVPGWFPPLVAEVRAELERIGQARQTSDRPLLELEQSQLQERMQGWALSLANRELPAETRRFIESQVAAASQREEKIAGELKVFDDDVRLAGEVLDPKKLVERLHRLDTVMSQGNPTATNVELALHVDRIEVFPEGKVIMQTCRLGMFEGLTQMLARPRIEAAPVEELGGTSGTIQRIRPRLLGRRASGNLTIAGQAEERGTVQPEDPARFAGLGLNWFWQDVLELPSRAPWYQSHGAEVLRVRSETGMSLAKLAKHFGKSKPTIMCALKFAKVRITSSDRTRPVLQEAGGA